MITLEPYCATLEYWQKCLLVLLMYHCELEEKIFPWCLANREQAILTELGVQLCF